MADIPEEPSPPPVVLNGAKAHCKVNGSSLKEKTPMCLVNELARYNQIPHQYRLTHEDGPAHKKVFTVTLKLGNEEYQADGSSIKKAQHSAAQLALNSTTYKHPPEKSTKPVTSRRNITPTVELNALAMKRGEVTEYSFLEVPPYAQGNPDTAYHHHVRFRGRGRGVRGFRAFKRGFPHTRGGAGYMAYHVGPSPPYPDGTYRVLLKVSDREYTGSGSSPQSARHDAATQALKHMTELMSQDDEHGEGDETCPVCPSERKSPVSLVHEMALKRKLAVSFEVVEEKGQPHMRMYYTRCTVGNLVTMGEGNGKKISKGKAAELMLEELSRLPEVTENPKSRFKRRLAGGGNTNVKGARRKPGRNQKTVTVGDKCTIAVSSNKKSAMRNAAQLMLIDLGQTLPKEASKKKAKKAATPADRKRTKKEPKTNGVAEIETNEVASNVSVETVVTLQPDAPVPSTYIQLISDDANDQTKCSINGVPNGHNSRQLYTNSDKGPCWGSEGSIRPKKSKNQ
ncbi:double-stranded RNA-binding protein Staufen homolog [Diaphorina citri]|uniref:Double-stranded RNA-binding protein Staufen homolog n=1 Tax=Diaphorina citri TaxID=121845 RepID=A0A3Q0IZW8_DIACI|nr:double-stranded RNA-binding protein Staufen homolog [Diaphorina citri]